LGSEASGEGLISPTPHPLLIGPMAKSWGFFWLWHCVASTLPAVTSANEAVKNVSIPTMEIASGVHMPILSIGTGGLESKAATTIVLDWLAINGQGVDTAFVYRNQDSVREAIAKAGVPRSKLFITSKIPGCFLAKHFLEADIRQLGLDYIDLLLIHSPRPSSGCKSTWEVLEEYHAKGVLKAIGVSNFNTRDLTSLLSSAKVVPAVNQIEHNVLHHDDETISFCKAHNITIEAYSPLGRSNHSGDIPGNQEIQAIAAKHKVSTYQVALKWILQHGHILTFQSSSKAHQQVDAALFGFKLSPREMSKLDALQEVSPTLRSEVLEATMVV